MLCPAAVSLVVISCLRTPDGAIYTVAPIVFDQVPFQLGINFRRPTGLFEVPLTTIEIFRHIPETNLAALLTSILTIVFLMAIKVSIEVKMLTCVTYLEFKHII